MTIQPITALRQRMIEDMTIRRLKERTQDFYQRAVATYAQHFRTSPAKLDYEHVRQYQLIWSNPGGIQAGPRRGRSYLCIRTASPSS
jgi:integrase/recombinase XerD